MDARSEELLTAALALPEADRLEMARRLLASAWKPLPQRLAESADPDLAAQMEQEYLADLARRRTEDRERTLQE